MNETNPEQPYGAGGAQEGQQPYASDPYHRQQFYDPYAAQQQHPQQHQQQGYGYDAYGGQQFHDPYAAQQPQQPQQQGYGYDPYAQPQAAPQQVGEQQWIPQQQSYPAYAPSQPQPQSQPRAMPAAAPQPQAQPPHPRTPQDDEPRPAAEADYRTEQFAFVEDPDGDPEDVIDWLKFTESRSERRDERKRKSRNRVVALTVSLALALVGGLGYAWYAGLLPAIPGVGSGATAAGGPEQRDVIVVHLRDTKGGGSATALLVDNATKGKGTTVLLPNSLAVASDDGGATTLGKSVEDEGTGPTRDALGSLLGADIKGSWRLDTPYLENLVKSVGGIKIDTNAPVPSPKRGEDPLVKQGKGQFLDGPSAVAYATLLQRGEQQTEQLKRFGDVMRAVLGKLSSDPDTATTAVRDLDQIPDPSLSEDQLGGTLAQLAGLAQRGAYDTRLLPVRPDGTLSEADTESVVKDVLGGTVENTDPDTAPRISVRNASGDPDVTADAQVALVNGGYAFVDGGSSASPQPTSQVTYADDAHAGTAREVAKTLGLPDGAVKKGRGSANADVTVVAGGDWPEREK